MVDRRYTANKSRTQGRQAWSVSFRHPLRTDSKGKPGLKVRKGLGTTDEAEADRLVAQLNELLGDVRFLNASAKNEAAGRFATVVVDAFYADIDSTPSEGTDARDAIIPLPGAAEGYAHVLLVGTTGAGKTTLLRQLIGSHPRRDKFPSTSTGKTTVADIEVVMAGTHAFDGVVTFFPERAVRGLVQECVTAAAMTAWKGSNESDVARALLQHAEQRFRLNYVLGDWPAGVEDEEEDWGFAEEDDSEDSEASDGLPTEDERRANVRRLQEWVQSIRNLVQAQGAAVARMNELDWADLTGEDLETAEAYLVDAVESSEEYADLVLEILEQIQERFDRLDSGEVTRSTTGWPVSWSTSIVEREDFLRAMRWFSSNFQPRYGRLLTPLVQAMRVRGPFFPQELNGIQPRLVLIDGQGLGHTPDSAASVTTNITRRFASVDAILLVDSAKQPMQAAPLAVLRSVATGGYAEKLAIAFTHFDQVSGANLPTVSARREHVIGAVRNALASLRNELGATLVRSLESEVDERCFMLGWLHQAAEGLKPKVKEQLHELITFVESSITLPEPIPAAPIYDPASLLFAVQAATRDFQSLWAARLGLELKDGTRKEHWTRIKALNRRVADGWSVEYDNLMPVADLFSRLSEAISLFLEHPLDWSGDASNEAERDRAVAKVRRAVAEVLHGFALQRVIQRHLQDWVRAYGYAGRGSTLDRARDIRAIYEDAAPIPGVIATEHTRAFLEQVRELVHRAIEAGDGKLARVTV
jgi:energy-coupling factor transporter ATP-binding protein EcfA2